MCTLSLPNTIANKVRALEKVNIDHCFSSSTKGTSIDKRKLVKAFEPKMYPRGGRGEYATSNFKRAKSPL
jgi:hypothetical protein